METNKSLIVKFHDRVVGTLDTLYSLGGTSGGARPKSMTE